MTGPAKPARSARVLRGRRRAIIAVAVLLVLSYPGATYVRALTYPGAAGVGVRTVDWLRDLGMGGVVDVAENWWYTRHQPSSGPPDTGELPATATPAPPPPGPRPGAVSALPGTARAPGAGVWVPRAPIPGGSALYTTFVQPDRQHSSVIAAAAWLNQDQVRTALVAGTREPGGSWPGGAQVAPGSGPTLLATFNSGFKMIDAHGGYYSDGRFARPLRDGAASLVIRRDGTVAVAQWGRDATLTGDIVAVRQNLDLVIDNGSVVEGITQNLSGRWGSAGNQFQFTWRSGIGTDAAGNLIYVAGDKLTLSTLATAMRAVGITRGMELDIHTDMVSFNVYTPTMPLSAPSKLLPAMVSPSTRYLTADQRDFFTVQLRHPPLPFQPPSRQRSAGLPPSRAR